VTWKRPLRARPGPRSTFSIEASAPTAGFKQMVGAWSRQAGDAERRLALTAGAEQIATDLLRSRPPRQQGAALMAAAVVAATIAGDRSLLRSMPTVIARLVRYLPPDEEWAEHWHGWLDSVDCLALLAADVLEVEAQVGTAGDQLD
jgi:hypothetical protein